MAWRCKGKIILVPVAQLVMHLQCKRHVRSQGTHILIEKSTVSHFGYFVYVCKM